MAQRTDLAALPLAGVPIAVKDNVAVAGEPMRAGSLATSGTPQPADHPVVQRLRDAGAVVVGLTRTPELCVFGATDSAYGITRNPWAPDRTAGGSSGGTAAAVAAGLVPAGHGNDGMGSIRIPAACCGLVGIKPGNGVVPAGIGANDWFGMAENGPLATTVRDAALVLSVMADDPVLADVGEPAAALRVAVSTRSPALRRAARPPSRGGGRAGRRSAGRRRPRPTASRPALPGQPPARAGPVGGRRLARRRRPRPRPARSGRPPPRGPRRRRPAPADGAARSSARRSAPAGRVLRAGRRARDAGARFTAPRRGPVGQRRWSRTFAANVRYAPYAAPWNFAGYPAMTVPAGVHPRTGTPLAVQLVGPDGAESAAAGAGRPARAAGALAAHRARLLTALAPPARRPPGQGGEGDRTRGGRRADDARRATVRAAGAHGPLALARQHRAAGLVRQHGAVGLVARHGSDRHPRARRER